MSSLPSYSFLPEPFPSVTPPHGAEVEAALPHVAVSTDGFLRRCSTVEILKRHLAHMTAAVTALRLSKTSVAFCLSEQTTFIRPPWSRDRQTSEAFAVKDGMGVRLSPLLHELA